MPIRNAKFACHKRSLADRFTASVVREKSSTKLDVPNAVGTCLL